MKGIFITGTDTGVGKTFVAVGLLMALREMGYRVCPMKPLETGCKIRNGRLIPQDVLRLMKASGVKEPVERINPYRFRHPLAPSVAAVIEGKSITRQKILSAYRSILNRYDLIVVEGAGGIMVPVYKEYLFLHMVKDMNLPLIIVSKPALGTINHTLLTIEVARRAAIEVVGVIINYAESTKKGIAEKTNPDVIQKVGKVALLGVVPHVKGHNQHPSKVFLEIAKRIILQKI